MTKQCLNTDSDEISSCRKEPEFISENVQNHFELYRYIQKGMQDIKNGQTCPISQAFVDIRERRKG